MSSTVNWRVNQGLQYYLMQHLRPDCSLKLNHKTWKMLFHNDQSEQQHTPAHVFLPALCHTFLKSRYIALLQVVFCWPQPASRSSEQWLDLEIDTESKQINELVDCHSEAACFIVPRGLNVLVRGPDDITLTWTDVMVNFPSSSDW
jgi:hypothetical protein